MKVLKICIMALSLGIFITSCQSTTQCPTTTADSSSSTSSVSTVTPADGTNTAAAPATDTVASGNMSGAGTNVHTVGMRHRHDKNDTFVDNSRKGVKKQVGNFTNGTGSDNPGR